MKTRYTIIILSLGILFLACSDDPTSDFLPEGKYPINITAEINNADIVSQKTNASIPDIPEVGIIIKDITGNKQIYANEKFSGKGGELILSNLNNQKYWESNTQKLNIYAYAPYNNGQVPEQINISPDQSGGYLNSDFLYAKLEDQGFADRNNLKLTFHHHLSKIVVNLLKGAGISEEELASAQVQVTGTNTSAGFDLETGLLTNHAANQDIEMAKENNSFEAIVIPQVLSTENDFIKVIINGKIFYAPIGGANNTYTFEGGKQYTFNITVNKDNITMGTVSVEPWEKEDTKQAIVYPPEVLNLPNCYAVKIGDSDPAAQLEIPVIKAYAMWETYPGLIKGLNGSVLDNNVTAEVVWMDKNVGIDLAINGSGKNAKIVVKLSDLTPGNILIAAKINGSIRWSWHIWVTFGDVFATTYNYNGYNFMDRNLGATSSEPGDTNSKGLLYQWGRKDPFPVSNEWNNNEPDLNNKFHPVSIDKIKSASSDPSVNLSLSVQEPLSFITSSGNIGDWYATTRDKQDDSLWGHNKIKSPFDPCPEGWRVPGYKNNISPWENLTIQGLMWSNGWDFDQTDKKLGYYPASGMRSVEGLISETGSHGFYHTASTIENSTQSSILNFNSTYFDAGSSENRANGNSVRCVKERP